MPTKVSVGLSKKRGLPDFGSIGASCHVELELDTQILDKDQERFRQHVRRAYAACREVIEEELARDVEETPVPAGRESAKPEASGREARQRLASNGTNGHHHPKGRPATESQLRAIRAIASRNHIELCPLLERLGVTTVHELTVAEASAVIDALKAQVL